MCMSVCFLYVFVCNEVCRPLLEPAIVVLPVGSGVSARREPRDKG